MNPRVDDDGSTKDDSINSEHHDHDSDDSYQLVGPSTATKGSSPPELVQKGRNNDILKKSEAIKRARQWAENRRRATEASSRSRRAETEEGVVSMQMMKSLYVVPMLQHKSLQAVGNVP